MEKPPGEKTFAVLGKELARLGQPRRFYPTGDDRPFEDSTILAFVVRFVLRLGHVALNLRLLEFWAPKPTTVNARH
ncbi:MAG: hypothetical protein Ct9H300mP8_04860 [Gammaproteobacteria bacterium]|nr:MAG: hypothetical protein Ct9H300mP8_04860 [Gammaproteobacteria bacterium]